MPVDDPTPDDQIWQEASAQLAPAKSLERTNDNARSLAASLGLISSLITGVGLLSIDRLRSNFAALTLVEIAAALGAGGVLLSVIALIFREKTVHLGNLDEVKAWYTSQERRGWILTVAGALLVAGILVGVVGSGVAVLSTQPTSSLSLQLSGNGSDKMISAKIAIDGLMPGTRVDSQVIGQRANSMVTLFQNVSLADSTGKVDLTGDVPLHEPFVSFELQVTPQGQTNPFRLDLREVSP
jgi:hypothetical protein